MIVEPIEWLRRENFDRLRRDSCMQPAISLKSSAKAESLAK
nr:MAG TPA: hypothetical protein [Microviridae sp.]